MRELGNIAAAQLTRGLPGIASSEYFARNNRFDESRMRELVCERWSRC
jgi:hypothetical protein